MSDRKQVWRIFVKGKLDGKTTIDVSGDIKTAEGMVKIPHPYAGYTQTYLPIHRIKRIELIGSSADERSSR